MVESEGRPQVISPAATMCTPTTFATGGEEQWVVRYTASLNVPRPVFGHGLVYVCTGYMKPELWAIRLDGKGDADNDKRGLEKCQASPANPSPVFSGRQLVHGQRSGRGDLPGCADR